MTKKKPSSVRHTRSNQVARGQKQPSMPPDEVTVQRIKEVIHPATLAQVGYYQKLGLRERTLSLPITKWGVAHHGRLSAEFGMATVRFRQ